MSNGQKPFSDYVPINIVSAKRDFDASNDRQLTIEKGETLLLLSNPTGKWAAVRDCTVPITETADCGLVPTSCLAYPSPKVRGYALHAYHPESKECVPMSIGRKLGVYWLVEDWALVKLDETDSDKAEIGFVKQGYIQTFDESGKEEQVPSSLRLLPEKYCFLCESSVVSQGHFECTQCRLPNGHPFLICLYCVYRRQACFAHQVLNGEDHLFDWRNVPFPEWWCDVCTEPLDGNFYTCMLCRYLTGEEFDMCSKCRRDPTRPAHEHTLIFVSKNWRLTEPHAVGFREIEPKRSSYTCNGCCQHISGYVLHCRVCPSPGFVLCLECAELDRATYLHGRWTHGAPHDFEIAEST